MPQKRNIAFYLLNGFVCTLPILLWNIAYTSALPALYQPAVFWQNVPTVIAWGEHGTRVLLFALLLFMPLARHKRGFSAGLWIYIAGSLVYALSWVALMAAPQSSWSLSYIGLAAPAYTPVLWLLGIYLMTDSSYFRFLHTRLLFHLVALAFLVFHNLHVAWVLHNVN